MQNKYSTILLAINLMLMLWGATAIMLLERDLPSWVVTSGAIAYLLGVCSWALLYTSNVVRRLRGARGDEIWFQGIISGSATALSASTVLLPAILLIQPSKGQITAGLFTAALLTAITADTVRLAWAMTLLPKPALIARIIRRKLPPPQQHDSR